LTEEESSSAAEATDYTLVASSEAAATATAIPWLRSAVEVSDVAEASSWVDADDTSALEITGELQHAGPALGGLALLYFLLLRLHADLG
jgi:hypothetical protein